MIPYIGEKSHLSHFIIPNIPTDISTYVEPFGGMFSIFFKLDLEMYIDTRFIYNDINYLNYNLFNQLKDDNFLRYLESVDVTEKIYEESKSKIYNTDVDKAISWLILLTCGDSKIDILNASWKGNYEFEILKIKLHHSRSYFNKISIYNKDYKDIISEYDSESTFFYIDPPYFGKELYYINHDFTTINHHEELSKILKNIKARFALSYLQFPNINQWYKDFNFKNFQTFMGNEILITNY